MVVFGGEGKAGYYVLGGGGKAGSRVIRLGLVVGGLMEEDIGHVTSCHECWILRLG